MNIDLHNTCASTCIFETHMVKVMVKVMVAHTWCQSSFSKLQIKHFKQHLSTLPTLVTNVPGEPSNNVGVKYSTCLNILR